MRALVAGVAGFLLYLFVAVGGTLLVGMLSGDLRLQGDAPVTSPLLLATGLFMSGIAVLAATWASIRMAGESTAGGWICTALIVLFVAISTIAYWNHAPAWYNIAGLLVTALCLPAGWFLAGRKSSRNPSL